jgi:membrane peptidoglycan carboxypeptidase
MILRFLKRLFVLIFLLCVLAAAGAGGGLYWLVVVDPGHEIELSYIESILGRESPVFYRDGKEKIGVLFQDAHRQYLPYRNIPKGFVNAIIAAEDDQFFRHFGVDFFGIARAMIANFKAGRIIQGGSTITQQTAKNLFKRESRTYKAKLIELL